MCDGLKKRYGLVHISPGQILRDEVCKESDLGLQVPRGSLQSPAVVCCMPGFFLQVFRGVPTYPVVHDLDSHDDPQVFSPDVSDCNSDVIVYVWLVRKTGAILCKWTYQDLPGPTRTYHPTLFVILVMGMCKCLAGEALHVSGTSCSA